MNKIKSIFIFLMLFLGLIFGFATTPVIATIGLQQYWTDSNAWVDTNNDMAFDVSKNGDYVGVCGRNSTQSTAQRQWIYDADGNLENVISASGGYVPGGSAGCSWMNNQDRLFTMKTPAIIQECSLSILNTFIGDTIGGLTSSSNNRLFFTYNDNFLLYSCGGTGQDMWTTVIDMTTYGEEYTLQYLGNADVHPSSLIVAGTSDGQMPTRNFIDDDERWLLTFNIQTGILINSVNMTTLLGGLGTNMNQSNWNIEENTHVACSDDYIYIPVYNNDDNSEFYVFKSDYNLNSLSVFLDNTSLSHRNMKIDVTSDDEYFVVGYDSIDSMQMFDISSGTQIDTGSDGAVPIFSLDGSVVFVNDMVDDDLFYYDTEYLIDLGGSGQGEGDTDLDDYEQRCTGALLYDNTVYYNNISNYISNIGDISLVGVELRVNNYQIDIITSNKLYYSAYLNGVYIGYVDEIFQSSPNEYTLQWSGFDIDIGNNDIILEFRNSIIGFGQFWNIPMGYTDVARYGGIFGNGNFDGTLFDGYLGLGTCIYYDINDVTPSDNTYALSLVSIDPHWRGNSTSWSMTVTGDESWTWLIVDPNGDIVYQDYQDNANNIFYRDRLVQSDFVLGEYTIYALDYDNGGWVTGYTSADNITFNVTAYGGSQTAWSIKASRNPIIVGTYQGYSYFVPSGYPYAILWREESTAESGYLEQGVGDGELHTIDPDPNFKIDTAGYWDVILQNRTSSNTDEWTTYRDTFLATGSISNYIEYGKQGNYICDTSFATIRGFYDGGVGTLWFKLNENVFKSFALQGGDFSQEFYPDDYEDAWGVYVVYITNSEGEILDWSTGLYIEVYDCDDAPPIDPDLTPMYRGNVVMGSVLSLIIIVVLMLLPYAFMMGLSKTGQDIKIPPLVPIGFGMVGFIFCSAMMFIDPMYLVAFIVVILIVTLLFIYGKFGKSDD